MLWLLAFGAFACVVLVVPGFLALLAIRSVEDEAAFLAERVEKLEAVENRKSDAFWSPTTSQGTRWRLVNGNRMPIHDSNAIEDR